MSLKKFFLRSNFTYKIYLYYNLYIRHKCFLRRKQYSQWGEDLIIKELEDRINKLENLIKKKKENIKEID